MQIIEFLAPHFVWFNNPTAWIALLTLIVMEVVLGIDNLIFISILTNKLPAEQQKSARRLGISAALIMRLVLLATISFIVRLTEPIFTAGRSRFLVARPDPDRWRPVPGVEGDTEIHHNVDHDEDEAGPLGHVVKMTLGATIFQILLLDLVFSIDSIITAVGMTDEIAIMYIAVIVAVTLMLVAAEPLSRFIARNPTIVMLALGFLLMIGMTLIADGMGYHVPKGYIYAAMGFSALVEGLNMLSRRGKKAKQRAPDTH